MPENLVLLSLYTHTEKPGSICVADFYSTMLMTDTFIFIDPKWLLINIVKKIFFFVKSKQILEIRYSIVLIVN